MCVQRKNIFLFPLKHLEFHQNVLISEIFPQNYSNALRSNMQFNTESSSTVENRSFSTLFRSKGSCFLCSSDAPISLISSRSFSVFPRKKKKVCLGKPRISILCVAKTAADPSRAVQSAQICSDHFVHNSNFRHSNKIHIICTLHDINFHIIKCRSDSFSQQC